MKRTRLLPIILTIALPTFGAACGDDGTAMMDDGLADLGFATPTAVTTAYKEVNDVWVEQGPANWSCLNTASTDVPTTTDVTLSGPVLDFQTDEPLPLAELSLFGDDGIGSTAIATATTNLDGNYEIVLPAGGTHWAFKIVADEALDTYTLNQYFEPDTAMQEQELDSISVLTAQALPAFIGVTRTPGLGIVAGSIRDCDDNEVFGAVAMASDTVDMPSHIDGGVSYYFSALLTSLPVRHSQQSMTNKDGRFVTIELPTGGQGHVQVWGFTNEADLAAGELTLLSQISAPILGDTVVSVSLKPLRQ